MSFQRVRNLVVFVSVTLLLQACAVGAEQRQPERSGQGGPQGGPHGGPPPEAFKACKDRREGERVEFAVPNGGKVRGICREMKGQLLAVPEGAPGKEGGGPPPEGSRK